MACIPLLELSQQRTILLHYLRIVLPHRLDVINHKTSFRPDCEDLYVLNVFRYIRSEVHLELVALVHDVADFQ